MKQQSRNNNREAHKQVQVEHVMGFMAVRPFHRQKLALLLATIMPTIAITLSRNPFAIPVSFLGHGEANEFQECIYSSGTTFGLGGTGLTWSGITCGMLSQSCFLHFRSVVQVADNVDRRFYCDKLGLLLKRIEFAIWTGLLIIQTWWERFASHFDSENIRIISNLHRRNPSVVDGSSE
jgi:hypothetical protein